MYPDSRIQTTGSVESLGERREEKLKTYTKVLYFYFIMVLLHKSLAETSYQIHLKALQKTQVIISVRSKSDLKNHPHDALPWKSEFHRIT